MPPGLPATTSTSPIWPRPDPESISKALEHLLEQAIEGLVIIAPQVRVFDVLARMSIDVPYVSFQPTGGAELLVPSDQVQGARMATRHLIELGHREIIHLAGPQDWIEAEARMRGFLQEIDNADLMKSAGKPSPVVTGRDSEAESVKSIMAGEQYSTINKDTRLLVNQAITMVKDLQTGKKAPVNDTKSYNNGVKVVPAFLLPPVIVTKANAAGAYANDPLLSPLTK